MTQLITHQTVTVVRGGSRVKVKPTQHGAVFDFTDEEVASIEAAGGRLSAPLGPTAAQTVVEKAKPKKDDPPAAEEKPMTAAERKAADKAAKAAAATAPEDEL